MNTRLPVMQSSSPVPVAVLPEPGGDAARASRRAPALVTLTGSDGYPLHCRHWQPVMAPRAVVVMLHGVVSHSGWLQPIAAQLQQAGIACIGVDRRGAGLNQMGRGHCDDENLLFGDLDAALAYAANIDAPLHLAGFCWGSNYAVNYLHASSQYSASAASAATKAEGSAAAAASRPWHQSLASLMLLAPSLFPSAALQSRPFATGASCIASEPPVMPIEYFTHGPALDDFIRPDPLRLKAVSPALNGVMQRLSAAVWMKLMRLNLPVMTILAEADAAVDNAASQRILQRRQHQQDETHIVPGQHGVQFDANDQCAALILDWLRKIASESATADASQTGSCT